MRIIDAYNLHELRRRSNAMPSTPHMGPGPDLRGQVLGHRYRLDALVAWGGMASVYRAEDLRLRRRVAVKVIYPEHVRTELQHRRVLQEARLGAQIDHPHVVPVFDLGEEASPSGERRMYLVMPLVAGASLRELILDGPLLWTRAVDLTIQLLAGLAALHQTGALHRDIKPENCLVGRVDGRDHLRLADLGLAKGAAPEHGRSASPISLSGVILGTPAYLSPEQAQGHPLDARADLYSVGVVLYELLTRRAPFAGQHLQLLNAHVNQPPPPPRSVAPFAEIPADLETIVLRALAKDPSDRYGTAERFAMALERALTKNSTGQTPHCPTAHAGCDAAQESLAAWTRFEYELALSEGTRAARENTAWLPLRLLMSDLP